MFPILLSLTSKILSEDEFLHGQMKRSTDVRDEEIRKIVSSGGVSMTTCLATGWTSLIIGWALGFLNLFVVPLAWFCLFFIFSIIYCVGCVLSSVISPSLWSVVSELKVSRLGWAFCQLSNDRIWQGCMGKSACVYFHVPFLFMGDGLKFYFMILNCID